MTASTYHTSIAEFLGGKVPRGEREWRGSCIAFYEFASEVMHHLLPALYLLGVSWLRCQNLLICLNPSEWLIINLRLVVKVRGPPPSSHFKRLIFSIARGQNKADHQPQDSREYRILNDQPQQVCYVKVRALTRKEEEGEIWVEHLGQCTQQLWNLRSFSALWACRSGPLLLPSNAGTNLSDDSAKCWTS